jgi:hypothetical protein
MELQTNDFRVKRTGADTVIVPAGERLKLIQTDGQNPNIEHLNAKCPNGKSWRALVIVDITETDA